MDCMNVVIETPKGSTQKYDYDPKSHFFKLKKILPAGMVFPYDFGFIPGTKGEDGDPLDVIVVSELCSFPGCMIKAKIIGAFKAVQSEDKGSNKKVRNDRYLAVPKQSVIFEKIDTIDDLPNKIIKEIEDFFIDYNKIQGKEFKALDKIGARAALKAIRENEETES